MAITFHRNVGAPKAALLVTFTSLGLTALTIGLPADQTVKTFEVEVQVMAEGKPAEGAYVWMEERSGQTDNWKTIKTVGPQTPPESGTVCFSLTAGPSNYSVFAKRGHGELALAACYPKDSGIDDIGRIDPLHRLLLARDCGSSKGNLSTLRSTRSRPSLSLWLVTNGPISFSTLQRIQENPDRFWS